MSAPDLPRFKVSSDTWSVLPAQGVSPAKRKVSLDKRCAELEAWHAKAMSNDPARA